MRFTLSALLLACLLPAVSSAQVEAVVPTVIEFSPPEKANWTLRNVGAGVSSLFGGYSHWYENAEVVIETAPSEAQLSLYYIRSNFQKRFERTAAPVRLLMPPRIESTSRDALLVRVGAKGFLTREESYRVHDLPDRIVIALEPLPNSLVALARTHLDQRSTLTLRTTEEPDLRISRREGARVFTLAFAKTSDALDERPTGAVGALHGVEVAQVGEDLMIQVELADPALLVRSRSSYDSAREEHVLSLFVAPEGSRPLSAQTIERELAELPFSLDDRCALAMESGLRERLSGELLARSFRPGGGVAEVYQREALLRLGRLDRGRVSDMSGETYRTGSPIGLALAQQSGGQVRGYLGLLARFAETRPEPATFLRSLIAPELSATEFAPIWSDARAGCSGGG